MKILFVYQFCTLGGVETVLRNRLSAFYKKEIFPHVIFLKDLGGSTIFEGFKNIHYENREKELSGLIDGGDFDFVIPVDTPQIYSVLKRSQFKGILVTEVHTNNLHILRYLSNIVETETKAIITPSQFEKKLIHEEIKGFGKNGIPIHIVPNPINLELFHFIKPGHNPGKKAIGWIGRLEREKNWKHFLKIASFLSKKRNDITFLMIGGYNAEEPVKNEFRAMVSRWDLTGRLKWIPYLQYERMPRFYSLIAASGGCLVTTSILEPFGMTVIEAMACRCPVVASRVGGFLEIIEDGRNGFLFEANHTEQASGSIELFLDNPDERTRVTGNGVSTVLKNFTPDRIVEKYLGVLQSLL